jgi:clan AA aspartic protease (TIGR02281 family)
MRDLIIVLAVLAGTGCTNQEADYSSPSIPEQVPAIQIPVKYCYGFKTDNLYQAFQKSCDAGDAEISESQYEDLHRLPKPRHPSPTQSSEVAASNESPASAPIVAPNPIPETPVGAQGQPTAAAEPTTSAATEESGAQAGPSYEVVLKEEGGTFVVPVQINGAITLDFTVDSGAADVQIPVDVFWTLVRAKTIVVSDYIGEQTYTLADGSTQKEPRFIVRELKVGGHVLRDVAASVSAVESNLLLGESFLSRFAEWTLDNEHHVLKLVEKSAEPVAN